MSQGPSASSLLTGEQFLWKTVHIFSGYRKREEPVRKGGRDSSIHSTSGHFCVPVCRHVWTTKQDQGEEGEELFPHGNPFGWSWLSKNSFIFYKVLSVHSFIERKKNPEVWTNSFKVFANSEEAKAGLQELETNFRFVNSSSSVVYGSLRAKRALWAWVKWG